MNEHSLALEAIRKKLVGKKLNYKEIFAIMDEVGHKKMGDVLTTYFAASGYSKGFSDEEIFSLTKAMIETGEQLHFKGIVADKHSIGGVPGTRTSMIVIPIVAAAGYTIPKSSSRAITTPGGTADDMEVLAPVNFSKQEIYKIVAKTNGCIVWGGSVNIAPADDVLIKVEEPLQFESFDKILVSIMAKKVAFGSNHIVIDLPYGPLVKVHRREDAEVLQKKFEQLAKKFHVKLSVVTHEVAQPAGRGIGPLLEAKEALKVLEQHDDRPIDLEKRALHLAGILLDMCLHDSPKHLQDTVKAKFADGHAWATNILSSGKAREKMAEIIQAQGGKADIQSDDLHPGKYSHTIHSPKTGKITNFHIPNSTIIAKILGAPTSKKAGMYLNKKIGEQVSQHDILCTLYSESEHNLKEAVETLKSLTLYTIG